LEDIKKDGKYNDYVTAGNFNAYATCSDANGTLNNLNTLLRELSVQVETVRVTLI
jgi:hypothetical protein